MTIDEARLRSLPGDPGVYAFLDEAGRTLYVGKARSLRKRVRQYFSPGSGDTRFFVQHIRRNAARVETIVTSGDREALILENSLIKERQPRYNIRLRDDKEYLCIRIDEAAAWPRIELARRPVPDGARWFGPYHSAREARELARFLTRLFRLRTCRESTFSSRRRPCLQHGMGRCPAPCTMPVDGEAYRAGVARAILFLDGRVGDIARVVEAEMEAHAGAMRYEEAAAARDTLRALEAARERQRVVAPSALDQDAVGLRRDGSRAALAILFVRKGRLLGMRAERFSPTDLPDGEILASFLGQYYAGGRAAPDEVLLPSGPDDLAGLRAALEEVHGRPVPVLVPSRGRRRGLVDMAGENAARIMAEWESLEDPAAERLERLRDVLSLPDVPSRIECVDISHTAGRETVGSLAVMVDGEIRRSLFRRFRIRGGAAPGDDYAAMREVIQRRLERARNGSPGWDMPSLLVLDGGRGQLGMADLVLREMGEKGIPLAAISKDPRRERAARARGRVLGRPVGEDRGFDSVWLPGRSSGIPVRGSATPLLLLARLRDEAHRFAVAYHRKLRARGSVGTALTRIPGIGRATAVRLIAAFGSIEGVRAATAGELAARARLTARQVEAIASWRTSLPDRSDRD